MPAESDHGQYVTVVKFEMGEEARRCAGEFLKKIIRIRGVRIEREDFLRQELRKLGLDDDSIGTALSATPVQAG